MTRRALVLGSGGNAAIAWEIGIIVGMADAGIELLDADLFVGTSAGSVVAAQITSGVSLEELFRLQVDPGLQPQEPRPSIDFGRWRADIVRAKEASEGPTDFLQRMGSLTPVTPATPIDRRNLIARRLPTHTWPEQHVRIVAVDADSGERCVFERSGEAELVDAVTASCAVAGIWPAVAIKGRRYIDGGFYSLENADLAAGAERVLVLTLPSRVPPLCVASLDSAMNTLRQFGTQAEVVHPDAGTQAAFASVGGNLLDPSVREKAARAGREQGREAARLRVASFWQRPSQPLRQDVTTLR